MRPGTEIIADTVAALRSEDSEALPTVWRSEASRRVLRAATWMAPTQETILLTGPSGSGKSYLAEIIHRLSPRASGPFCVIPVAGLSQTLVLSELFGHEAHAFTDAGRQRRIGMVEESAGGTVFLDEVGDIHPLTQVMLLRFLQERRFRRVGGNREHRSDVRILAATNRDLAEQVTRGAFREDLYFRMSTFTLELPELGDRTEDIPALADTFLSRLSVEGGATYRARRLSRPAMKALVERDWPGNIRELEKAVIWAFYHAGRREVIEVDDLPPALAPRGAAPLLSMRVDGAREFSAARFEAAYLETVLRMCDWNVSKAARLLQVKPDTVRDRMRRAGIRRPGERLA